MPDQTARPQRAPNGTDATPSLLTDGDVFTLIGHADWLRGNGAEDMPDWCLDLAFRIAHGIDPYLARRVNEIREKHKPGNQEKAG
ncbi:hypothetical protein P5X00_35890 [Paraburkholderia sp. A2RO-4L]|jgi:hypothetical protein|uniref:hypothetical protein n=1 Tax=Paraburkholderia sp. A2RO-4L TaxID=3028374 RepID=UPI003DA97311